MKFQAGMREGSVISSSDAATAIESPEVWAELRRELEDVGISATVAEERYNFIVNWLNNALADGLLDENARILSIDNEDTNSRSLTPTSDDAGTSSRSLTPTVGNDFDQDSNWDPTLNDKSISSRSLTPTIANDFEHDSSWDHTAYSESNSSERNTVGHRSVAMSAATSAFTAEVQRTCNERSVAEVLDPLAASSRYSLPSPSTPSSLSSQRSRRRRRPFGLVEKLFQKQTAIVQVASDNDIDKVARLLSMGMAICYHSVARLTAS
jgi:hypothetical protein